MSVAKNPANYFIRRDVQNLLISLTGFDLAKIFKAGFNVKKRNSTISLLTNQQLNKENLKTELKARRLLQIPPFLSARTKLNVILSNDQRLNPLNLKNTNYVFTDISLDIPDKVSSLV
jgi:hypothetical protein